jgi:Skp family chaperone for outer membrane proteins
MKRFSLFVASFAFAAIFAAAAYGQANPAGAAATGTGKIGLINQSEFADEKGGIAKFKTALNAFNAEFKPSVDELTTMDTKRQALAKEINTLQQQLSAGGTGAVPINRSTYDSKVEEYQNLEISMKRKQEDLKARQERRYAVVIGPVYGDIIKALNEFAKQKGYAVILDGAKLEQADILLGFDEKYNVTKEFIAFYNTRPAGTATTAAAPTSKP